MVNKALLALLGCTGFGLSLGAQALSLTVRYEMHHARFSAVSPTLKGLNLEYSKRPDDTLYLSGYILSDSQKSVDYSGLGAGVRKRFEHGWRLGSVLNAEIGYGAIEVSGFNNRNRLLSLSAGAMAYFELTDSIRFDAGAGYRIHLDTTQEVWCFDGSYEEGRRTTSCFENGGVRSYREKLGHGHGVYGRIGLGFSF